MIPVYNEEKTISSVLDEVISFKLPPDWEKQIIVVDDGSTDQTSDILARRDGFTLITKENGGKGSAVKMGFQACNGDYTIVKDADLEQSCIDIRKLLDFALKIKSDFLIGCRFSTDYRPKSIKMKMHQITNGLFCRVVSFLVSTRIDDVWSGYKMLSKTSLDVIKNRIKEPSIEFEIETIVIASKFGIRIDQLPIIYNPRWYDEGKKTSYRHALNSLRCS